MKLIIKLSPEITIKTRPVRKRFTQQLHTNIRRVFKRLAIPADVVLRWDMLEVVIPTSIATDKLDDSTSNEDSLISEASTSYSQRCEHAMASLKKIPGIAYFIRVQERKLGEPINDKEKALDQIYQETLPLVAEQLKAKTFRVRCKRQGDHVFNSHDVERYVGGGLNQHTEALGVSMRNADVTINLEIKQQRLFIVEGREKGLGGYPTSCVGPVLSLMSGGYDSSVASFDMIRRGMETHFCFFNLGGHAHEVGVKQISHFLWEQYASSHRTAFINVNFERVVEEILTNISSPYMGVVLKRMMVRAASAIADDMDIESLVTGECIAQVSSQTLKNLAVIDKATDTLILRPLITTDKTDIIAQAMEIGVATYAEHMPEYCAVISDKPTTAAKMPIVLHEEKKFNFAVLDDAVNNRQVTGIDKVYEQALAFDDIEMLSIPEPDHIVIDLRHDDEREGAPLLLHSNELLSIPFYKINSLFNSLDHDKEYLLYCDRGVMSQLHAVHLRAEGYNNVKIYRPKQGGS